jgi:DNA-binding protein HU-beta
MNYRELIDQLSSKTGRSKKEIKELLGVTVEKLTEQLSDGKGVSVPDLGTFSTKTTEEKKVYNPHYEDYIMVPPKRTVEFSPAIGLKESVKFTEGGDE